MSGSKRGSRYLRRRSGRISRRRVTGLLEVCSWGACLELREGLGASDLSFSGREKREGGSWEVVVLALVLVLDLRLEGSAAWARARAPKEIEERSTLGWGGASSSELEEDCLSDSGLESDSESEAEAASSLGAESEASESDWKSTSSSRRARTRLSKTEGCLRLRAMLGRLWCCLKHVEVGVGVSGNLFFWPAILIDK